MTIKSLKDLKQVIALCRKSGVLSIEVDGIKLQLAPIAPKASKTQQQHTGGFQEFMASDLPPEAEMKVPSFNLPETIVTPNGNVRTDSLTEEQLLFYSSGPDQNQSLEDAQ